MEHSSLESRLRTLGRKLKSRSKSPHPQTPSLSNDALTHLIPSVSSNQIVSKIHSETIWDVAFDEAIRSGGFDDFDDEIQQMRNAHRIYASSAANGALTTSPPQLRICKQVVELAEARQTRCQGKQWHLPGGRDIAPGEFFGRIASSVQKFVSVGDVIAQIDPIHVGLPWAGVRMILLLATLVHEREITILQGLATSSTLIFRYGVFEEVYLRGGCPVSGRIRSGLEKVLKELYTGIIVFLLKSHKYLTQGPAKRFARPAVSLEDIETLSRDIAKLEDEVQKYEFLELKRQANEQFLSIRASIGAYDDRLEKEQRERILDWISTVDYRSQHLDIHNKLLQGTAKWLFKRPEYHQWEHSTVSTLLWLRGDAGTGKSTLVSSVVDRLENQPRLDSREALAYFYCSRTSGHSERGDPAKILSTILLQLSCPLRGLPLKPPIVNRYNSEKALGSRQASLGLKDCEDLLTELVEKYYSHVTIVLDALDEVNSEKRWKLLKYLTFLSQPRKTIVKVFVSSRSESDIKDHFETLENVCINATDNAADIDLYVEREVEDRLLQGNATQDIKNKVKEVLNIKAQGMFRWAELQIDSLCDPDYIHVPEDLDEALRKLPSTLEETYSETLTKFQRYGDISKTAIESLLRWLMVAEEVLPFSEVQDAISTLFHNRSKSLDAEQMVKMSLSLVIIDYESQIFRFAHLSVREFLEKRSDYAREPAHALVAQLCLINQLSDKPTIVSEQTEESFDHYALHRWPYHCQKASFERIRGKLKDLLWEFLGLHGDKGAFNSWNRASDGLRLYGLSVELRDQVEDVVSFPAHPLFVASAFGFFEIIKSLIVPELDVLKLKNTKGRTCFEVAANHGQTDVLRTLLKVLPSPSDCDEWSKSLLIAGARGNVATTKLLLKELCVVNIDEEIIVSAAQNERYGVEMLQFLFDEFTDYNATETVIEEVARVTPSSETFSLLLQRTQHFSVTEAILEAAAANENYCSGVLKVLLEHLDDRKEIITEDVVVGAMKCLQWMAPHVSYEAVVELLNHPSCCCVSQDILEAAASCKTTDGIEILDFLLARMRGLEITQEVLVRAAANPWGETMIASLLEAFPEVEISGSIIEAALSNSCYSLAGIKLLLDGSPSFQNIEQYFLSAVRVAHVPDHPLKLLLARFPSIEITERMLREGAAYGNAEAMSILLKQPRPFSIDQGIICLAGNNHLYRLKMVSLLLRNAPEVQPSEALVSAVIGKRSGAKILQILIDRFGSIPVSLNILEDAARNRFQASTLLEMLLEHREAVASTPKLILAAARNYDAMQFLLHRFGPVKLTEDIINHVMTRGCHDSTLQLLLHQDHDFVATEGILECALSNSSPEIYDLLLQRSETQEISSESFLAAATNDRYGTVFIQKLKKLSNKEGLDVTEELIEAVLTNMEQGFKLLELVLSMSKNPVSFGEQSLKLAASNTHCGMKILELILSSSPKAAITQEVLLAGSRNPELGKPIVRFLLDNSNDLYISEDLLKAAAGNPCYGKQILVLLFTRLGGSPAMYTSEVVLQAAAGNVECGKRVLDFLFATFGESSAINITEAVLQTAVSAKPSYSYYGQDDDKWLIRSTMRLLLNHPTSRITTNVVQAAILNETYGRQLVEDLITHPKGHVKIDESIMEAAASNKTFGDSLTHCLLLQPGEVRLTEGLISTASLNTSCRKEIYRYLLEAVAEESDQLMSLLIDHISNDVHGIRDALFHAAYRGKLAAMRALLEHGANVHEEAEDIGNALHIAAFRGQLEAVELLVQYGADVNAPGGQHSNALLAACHRSNVSVAQFLLKAGAELEYRDSMGKTNLHRCLEAHNEATTDSLLALGASRSAMDKQNRSPLNHAAAAGFAYGVRALLDADADVSAQDSAGWTPLHWAARNGFSQIVETLLNAGASKETPDLQGCTPLEIAFFYHNGHLRYSLYHISKEMDLVSGLKAKDEYLCDACNMDIYGTRYNCARCDDYELCQRCMIDAKVIHDLEHTFESVNIGETRL